MTRSLKHSGHKAKKSGHTTFASTAAGETRLFEGHFLGLAQLFAAGAGGCGRIGLAFGSAAGKRIVGGGLIQALKRRLRRRLVRR